MHKKLISAVVMLLIAGDPAIAATAQYWVVLKAGDKACSVSKTKPDGATAMMVGKSSYKTAAEASAAMKAAAECKKK
jgi:hypothetical protein